MFETGKRLPEIMVRSVIEEMSGRRFHLPDSRRNACQYLPDVPEGKGRSHKSNNLAVTRIVVRVEKPYGVFLSDLTPIVSNIEIIQELLLQEQQRFGSPCSQLRRVTSYTIGLSACSFSFLHSGHTPKNSTRCPRISKSVIPRSPFCEIGIGLAGKSATRPQATQRT